MKFKLDLALKINNEQGLREARDIYNRYFEREGVLLYVSQDVLLKVQSKCEMLKNNTFKEDRFNFYIKEHYKNNTQLMEDEIYSNMIYILNNSIKFNITIEGQKDDERNDKIKGDEKEGLEVWEIPLIDISTIIFIVLISLIIMHYLRKKNASNKYIEEKSSSIE